MREFAMPCNVMWPIEERIENRLLLDRKTVPQNSASKSASNASLHESFPPNW